MTHFQTAMSKFNAFAAPFEPEAKPSTLNAFAMEFKPQPVASTSKLNAFATTFQPRPKQGKPLNAFAMEFKPAPSRLNAFAMEFVPEATKAARMSSKESSGAASTEAEDSSVASGDWSPRNTASEFSDSGVADDSYFKFLDDDDEASAAQKKDTTQRGVSILHFVKGNNTRSAPNSTWDGKVQGTNILKFLKDYDWTQRAERLLADLKESNALSKE